MFEALVQNFWHKTRPVQQKIGYLNTINFVFTCSASYTL